MGFSEEFKSSKTWALISSKKKNHFYYTFFISEMINFNQNLHDCSSKSCLSNEKANEFL